MPLLTRIRGPRDLDRLSLEELAQLAEEIRTFLVDAVSNSIERVKEGKQLGPSLADCRRLFAGSVLEMISVAEESGRLDQELVRIANVTEGDLDRQLKAAVALAEPLMLFLIAGFIGTIFIGMVIPIFTLQDYIK